MAIIRSYNGVSPRIADDVFIAENAVVIGDVEIGPASSIWYGVVARGDVHYIKIGDKTNIQDASVLHVQNGSHPLNIGNSVSIAHGVMVHGCTIHDNVLIGIGAIVLNGAVVEPYSLIAAGALIREGTHIPSGVLVAGVPGVVKRDITDEEKTMIDLTADRYVEYAKEYMNQDEFIQK